MLREAFRADPYPTSTAIETLASKMQLSAKTVINWFHNHRMRSKQQNRDENGKCLNGVLIKQEPDGGSLDGAQFSSQNSYTDSHNSSPDPTANIGDPANPALSPSSLDRSHVVQHNNTSNAIAACNNITRKRKSANPNYGSAGAVLDKHNTTDDDDEIDVTGLSEADLQSTSQPKAASKNGVGEAEAAELSKHMEADIDEEEDDDEVERKAKIARLEERVQKDDMKWEEETVVDRTNCLQKLESRVNNDSGSADDWEF